ncbi:MAG TPA: hypothetical protein VEZ48_05650 [Sphingomonadaceae bacterium]|nr:hypothetical protein [Sphingomonadaceae bacterium]
MTKAWLLVPLLLAGCSAGVATEPVRNARAETRLTQLLAGKVAVGTQSCISQRDATRQTVIDERTILFPVSPGRVYRNEIPGGCPGLESGSTLIRRTTGPSLCSGEIFQVREAGTGFSNGACSFGSFNEYRRPSR